MQFGAFASLLVTLAFVCSFVVDAKYATATDATFDSLVLKAKNPVVAMFCAEWSDPCRYSKSIIDEQVSKNPPVTMVYVDIDNCPETTKKYKITAVPTFHGFYNGAIKNTYVGPMSSGSAQRFITDLKSKSS